jgi:hypothetical protein
MTKESILKNMIGISAPTLEEIISGAKPFLHGVVFTHSDRIMYAKTGALGAEGSSEVFEVDKFPLQDNSLSFISALGSDIYTGLDQNVYALLENHFSKSRDSPVLSACLHNSRVYDSGDYGIFDTHANTWCTDETLSLKFPLIASHNGRMYSSVVYPDGIARITEMEENSKNEYEFEPGRILLEMKADGIRHFCVEEGLPHTFSGYTSPVSVIHTDGESFFLNGNKIEEDKNLQLKKEQGKIGAFSVVDSNSECSFIIYPKGKNIYSSVIDREKCSEVKRYIVCKGDEQIFAAAPVMNLALKNKIMALRRNFEHP